MGKLGFMHGSQHQDITDNTFKNQNRKKDREQKLISWIYECFWWWPMVFPLTKSMQATNFHRKLKLKLRNFAQNEAEQKTKPTTNFCTKILLHSDEHTIMQHVTHLSLMMRGFPAQYFPPNCLLRTVLQLQYEVQEIPKYINNINHVTRRCLLYTSPSPRD